MKTSKLERFGMIDVAQIAIGSVLLGFPIAVTEEVWELSKALSVNRTLLIAISSITMIAFFAYYMFYHTRLAHRRWDFVLRVTSVYLITLSVCAAILAAIDQLHLFVDPQLALKRTILVAFPASFSATIVDSLNTAIDP